MSFNVTEVINKEIYRTKKNKKYTIQYNISLFAIKNSQVFKTETKRFQIVENYY